MQTEIDLDEAVAAGIIGEDQAIALRNFQAERAGTSLAMAEKFLLFGGFADLMSAAGLALALVGFVGYTADPPLILAWFVCPPTLFALAWLLRPRLRSMSCTAMVIMLAFTGFLLMTVPILMRQIGGPPPDEIYVILFGVIPALAGAWFFWRAFRFPPTPAVIALLIVMIVCLPFMPRYQVGGQFIAFNIVLLIASLGVLAAAIWWDLTDIRRETERSQVAFWLHCAAGYVITRAAFAMLSNSNPFEENYAAGIGIEHAGSFALVYLLFALLSLLLDRRSLLIGSIMPSIQFFSDFGSEEIGMIFAGLSLILFTWGWNRWRRRLLDMLPDRIAAQVPRTDILLPGQRPTRRHLELAVRRFLKPEATR